MRILRVVAVLAALVAAVLVALPAAADDTSPAVDLTVGWGAIDSSGGGTAAEPAWIPLSALISIPTGHTEWTGTLTIRVATKGSGSGGLSPSAGPYGGSYGGNQFPVYQQKVSVHPGTPKSIVMYGLSQYPLPYEATLTDSRGTLVAMSGQAILRSNYATIGLLSDAPSAASLFRGVGFGQVQQTFQVRGHHFEKVENLPSNALALTGFHAIAIDDFDSSTLSQAQLRALQDYVGFGGSLVIGGGSGWRRTLAQLPTALVPLRPDSTAIASMSSVMELIGATSDLAAPVATGRLAPGARVVLADASGIPLMAELSYGSGRIVELTFDPALDPIFGTVVATQAWTEVFNRAFSILQFSGFVQGGPLPTAIGSTTGTSVPGGSGGPVISGGALTPVPTSRFGGGLESQVFSVLAASPASALPPLGLLGAVLVAYVILVGPANYLWFRRRRRRELTWVSVPLIAVLFTTVAYGAGTAYKGSDFLVNEIQLLRVAPGGSVDATMLEAIFNSRRGDFVVETPDGSFAATTGRSSPSAGTTVDHVNTGRHSTVELNDVPVWDERSIKVETPVRTGIEIESHLGIAGLHVTGTLTNHGGHAVRNLALLTVSGEWASLAVSLAPGATVSVDGPLGRIPDYSSGATTPCAANGYGCGVATCAPTKGSGCAAPPCAALAVVGNCSASGAPSHGGAESEAARTILAEVAAGASVMGRADIQALVGTVDPLPGITIQGRSPNRQTVAAVAEPVLLETLDILPSGWAGTRLVVSVASGKAGTNLNVWDFELPARVGGTLVLQYGTPGVPVSPKPGLGPLPLTPAFVEVYDWSTSRWSRLVYDVRCAGTTNFCATISSPQSANGLVRVRTHNNPFNTFQMQLISTIGAGA